MRDPTVSDLDADELRRCFLLRDYDELTRDPFEIQQRHRNPSLNITDNDEVQTTRIGNQASDDSRTSNRSTSNSDSRMSTTVRLYNPTKDERKYEQNVKSAIERSDGVLVEYEDGDHWRGEQHLFTGYELVSVGR